MTTSPITISLLAMILELSLAFITNEITKLIKTLAIMIPVPPNVVMKTCKRL